MLAVTKVATNYCSFIKFPRFVSHLLIACFDYINHSTAEAIRPQDLQKFCPLRLRQKTFLGSFSLDPEQAKPCYLQRHDFD